MGDGGNTHVEHALEFAARGLQRLPLTAQVEDAMATKPRLPRRYRRC